LLLVKVFFSKLKLLDSYLRSTILVDDLNGLIILFTKDKMLGLNYKILINIFINKKSKK